MCLISPKQRESTYHLGDRVSPWSDRVSRETVEQVAVALFLTVTLALFCLIVLPEWLFAAADLLA